MGVVNNGLVYALYDYEPDRSGEETLNNELTFKDGDQLRILRRGDENENEWWWARHETTQQEGYVPRNYFGVSSSFMKSFSIHSRSLFADTFSFTHVLNQDRWPQQAVNSFSCSYNSGTCLFCPVSR